MRQSVYFLYLLTLMFAFYFSWQHKTLFFHIKLTAAIRLNINRLSTGNKIILPLVFNLKETKLFKSIFEATRFYDQKMCKLPISFIVRSMDQPFHQATPPSHVVLSLSINSCPLNAAPQSYSYRNRPNCTACTPSSSPRSLARRLHCNAVCLSLPSH